MQLQLLAGEAPRVDPRPARVEPWKQFGDGSVRLYHGDCLDVLASMPARSVDVGITDPPYGIGFMGKEWDTFRPGEAETRIVPNEQIESDNPNLRGRTRAPASSPSAVEYDYSLTALRAFQAWTARWAREVFRVLKPGAHLLVCGAPRSAHRMVCGLEDAGFEIRDSLAWLFGQGFPKSHNLDDGLGTALKPGHEPIALARKPFDGTVEDCVAMYGTGALNIEAVRRSPSSDVGRWPPNVAMDADVAGQLDAQSGRRVSGANPPRRRANKFQKVFGTFKGEASCTPARGAEAGGASRFFFVAKPSRLERDFGCEDLPHVTPGACTDRVEGSAGLTAYAGAGRSGGGRNFHPTVKPVALMRWLLALAAPRGGVVLDPFVGSGTTGMACVVDGYPFIGIDERELLNDWAVHETSKL